jgi:pimeloyl-ACP methyl ester carboxylesterase
MRPVLPAVLLTSLSLLTGPAPASDLARERRIRAQIEEAILVGQVITLQTSGTPFMAIQTKAETPKPRGGVILLHGRGANPDWADVIHPLRIGLPPHGWETLSLQLPVAAPDAPAGAYRALVPEAFTRLAFAVEFLTEQGAGFVALVGHSLGARMALEWLARDPPPAGVGALVTIGLSADPQATETGTLGALARLRLPLLDLYGSDDLDNVRGSVRQRAAAALLAGNSHYRQMQVEGANHFFQAHNQELVERVRAWLNRMAREAPVRQAAP